MKNDAEDMKKEIKKMSVRTISDLFTYNKIMIAKFYSVRIFKKS